MVVLFALRWVKSCKRPAMLGHSYAFIVAVGRRMGQRVNAVEPMTVTIVKGLKMVL